VHTNDITAYNEQAKTMEKTGRSAQKEALLNVSASEMGWQHNRHM